MKHFVLYIVFFATGMQVLNAQKNKQVTNGNSIAISYDDVSAGRNMALTFHHRVRKNWSFYAGVKYFINSPYFKNDPGIYATFFKEFYAKNFASHFGLKLGAEKTIANLNKNSQLFGFYDFQFTKGNIDNIYKVWYANLPPFEEHHDLAINAFENSLGLGYAVKIADRLKLRLQTGVGISFYGARNEASNDPILHEKWIFNRILSLGVAYSLESVQKQKKEYNNKMSVGNSLMINYNDVQSGSALSIAYQYKVNKNIGIYAGVKFQFEGAFSYDYTKMNQSYYFKQFRPSGFSQRIGLKAGIEYGIKIPESNITLFGFYDFQVLRCNVKNLAGLDYFASGLTRITDHGSPINLRKNAAGTLPDKSTRTYGPILALENYIGLGLKLPVNEHINFRIQGGVGYNFYPGPESYQPYDIRLPGNVYHYENTAWTARKSEFSRMYSLGLEFKFGKGYKK